jgi:hypothetical protein
MLHIQPVVLIIRANVTHQEVEKYHIVMLAITDLQGGHLVTSSSQRPYSPIDSSIDSQPRRIFLNSISRMWRMFPHNLRCLCFIAFWPPLSLFQQITILLHQRSVFVTCITAIASLYTSCPYSQRFLGAAIILLL